MLKIIRNIVAMLGAGVALVPLFSWGAIPYGIPGPENLILLPANYFEAKRQPMEFGHDPYALMGNYFGVGDYTDNAFEDRERPVNSDPQLGVGSIRARVYIPPGQAGEWCWHALVSGLNGVSDSFFWQLEGYERVAFNFYHHMGVDTAEKFRMWDGLYSWRWVPVRNQSDEGPRCYDLSEGFHWLSLIYREPGAFISAVAGVRQGAEVDLPAPEILLAGEVEDVCWLSENMQVQHHRLASNGLFVNGITSDSVNPSPYGFVDHAACPFRLDSQRYISVNVRAAACIGDTTWFVIASQDPNVAFKTPWSLDDIDRAGCPEEDLRFRWKRVTHRPEADGSKAHQWWVDGGNHELAINPRAWGAILDKLVIYNSGDCLGPWEEDGSPGLCIPPYVFRDGTEPAFLRVYAEPAPIWVYADDLPEYLGLESERWFETQPGREPSLLAEIPYTSFPYRHRVLHVTFSREDLLQYSTDWGGVCLAHEAVYPDPANPGGWVTSERSRFQCYMSF